MKKILTLFVFIMFSISAIANGVEIDGIFYILEGDSATVTYTSVVSPGTGSANEYYQTTIVIPDTVTYLGTKFPVTTIGEDAFCSAFVPYVELSDNVKYIKRGAFFSSMVYSINLNRVEVIEDQAFFNCEVLENVSMPSVKSIKAYAFCGCRQLSSLQFPSSLCSIVSSSVQNCENLQSISVAMDNPIFDSRENCNAIIETGTNTIVVTCKESIIPSSITKIGRSSFYASDIESIIIPNSVDTIEDGAFSDCAKLSSIVIPSSVRSIGLSNPFEGCSSLSSIIVEDGNQYYDSRNDCNAIIRTLDSKLITGCYKTVIPNTVTSIANYAFRSCDSLKSIIIPENVSYVGRQVFFGCPLSKIFCRALYPPYVNGCLFMYEEATQCASIDLYVPFEAVDAYRNVEPWSYMNVIGVSVDSVSLDTVQLSWYSNPTATDYVLKVYQNLGAGYVFADSLVLHADKTIDNAMTVAAMSNHRIPSGDGGTVIVITIDPNSGQDYLIRVNVSTPTSSYIICYYELEAYNNELLLCSNTGYFALNDSLGIFDESHEIFMDVSETISPSLPTGIYDLYGHRYSAEMWETLPAGVYVVREEDRVEKVMKK